MDAIPRGTHKDLIIQVKDATGAAVPISGYPVVDFTLSRKRGDEPDLVRSLGSGVAITDGANGEVTVSLDDSDTNRLGDFAFQCLIQDPLGNISQVANGYLTFEDS